jgi:hypothetical protein
MGLRGHGFRYLFGNQVRHPPALYLGGCFALSGEAGVSQLRQRLGTDANDLTIRDIAVLLSDIDAMGAVNVSADESLLAALRARVLEISDENWRKFAEEIVAGIGKQPKTRKAAKECQ